MVRNDGKMRKRCKLLLDKLKVLTRYWKLKEDVTDRTLWRTLFGTGYGHVFKTSYGIMN
jgi:hypothetical protein